VNKNRQESNKSDIMESVSNIASAASRAIFGEQGQQETSQNYNTTQTTNANETRGVEPISGERGDVSRGEPYDKGNLDPSTTQTGTTSASKDSATSQYGSAPSSNNPVSSSSNLDSSSNNPLSSSSNLESSNKPASATPTSGSNPALAGNTPSSSENARPTGPSHAEGETGKTATSSFNNPTSGTTTTGPTSAGDNSGPGASPSVGADPASGAKPKVKQQGADKPDDKPDSGESQKIQDTKKEAEEAADKKVDGPGPMTLEEKARSGGGNAGAKAGDEDEDGPTKPSTGEGTGEKYVKSSGMKAEGGDFDAANPGAGREADRLLEEKGIHREGGESKVDPDAAESGEAKPQKQGLGEKIKAKLHKH